MRSFSLALALLVVAVLSTRASAGVDLSAPADVVSDTGASCPDASGEVRTRGKVVGDVLAAPFRVGAKVLKRGVNRRLTRRAAWLCRWSERTQKRASRSCCS
jgi:hypothetical protein